MIRLDTHVLLWIVSGHDARIPPGVRRMLVGAANALSWTRDPFDLLIAVNALADGCELLTADVTMRAHLPSARWD